MTDDSFDNLSDAPVVGGAIVTPDGTIPLSAEQAEELKAAAEAAEAERKAKIQDLVDKLIGDREKCIRAKRPIEKRWIDDLRQRDGDARLADTKEYPSQSSDDSRPPKTHLTKSRRDIVSSRMIDLIAPTSDPTWDLRPLTQEDQDPPQGVDPVQWVQSLPAMKADAEQKAGKMKAVIQDQLAACNAQKALRKMCDDACDLGTGLIMGPMTGTHIVRKYNADPQNPVKVQIIENTIPEVREGDPWCFYPDMVSSAEKAQFANYLHLMGEVELFEFADFPGVDKDEVLALLDEDPEYGEIAESIRCRNEDSGYVEELNNRYAVWRYTGVVKREYLEALGIDTKTLDGLICADIWYSNKHILKAKITMLSAVRDFRIPYYVYSPSPLDGTMFGASVAYLCRDAARSADAAWLIWLHNASVSAGPQMFMRRGKLTPADGKQSVKGPKLWYVNDETITDINSVFQVVNIPNTGEAASQVLDASKQLMDEVLNTTQWASPDTSEEVQTASGLAMLMNSRTILQRKWCATADDDVLRPLIERFVLWNLMYNKRQDIKGDYDVLPLCQSVRLVKDIQIQQKLFVATQLAPSKPGMFDDYDMTQDIIRDLDVQVDNWMVPKDQYQKAQQQMQQSPQSQAQLAQIQLAQARAKTESLKQQKMIADAQAPAEAQPDPGISPERALDHQEFLIQKQSEGVHLNAQLAMHQVDAQAKAQAAADKAQADGAKVAAAMDANVRRERGDLIKTGVQAHVALQKQNTTFPKGAAPRKLPTGEFHPRTAK